MARGAMEGNRSMISERRSPRGIVARAIAPWLAACAVLDAAAAGLGAALYRGLPDPLATHFRADGTADAFAPKSWLVVFGPLIGSAALVLVLAGVAVVLFGSQLGEGRTAPDATDAELRLRGRLRRRSAGTTMGAVCVLVTVLAGLATISVWLERPLLVLAAAGIAPSAELAQRDRTFRWGMAHDAADPHLFVPKRLGFGYTLNLAHPAATWVLIGFAVVILVIAALPVVLGR